MIREDWIEIIEIFKKKLSDLKVAREYVNLRGLSEIELEEIADSFREQLRTRNKFLGVNVMENETQKIIEEFNRRFPVGATVRWRSIGKDNVPFREYTVQYPAEDHCGLPVAWFVEKSGLVSVERAHVDYGKAEAANG